jgi:hypothetical protein
VNMKIITLKRTRLAKWSRLAHVERGTGVTTKAECFVRGRFPFVYADSWVRSSFQ